MTYKWMYQTPKGVSNIIMNSDEESLTGLWFEGSRDIKKHEINCEEKNKIELLKLENNDMSKFFIPKRGTKL